MTHPTIADVDGLLAALARGVELDDEEGLDLLAHSLQCAANLSERAPDDGELQIAGLVHDLGTILEPRHPESHARVGGDAIRGLLGDRVAELVTGHDVAKRYLVTVEPAYAGRLSSRSVFTLGVQGGLLDDDERAHFEQGVDVDACVTLRRADDDAKVPGREVPPLEHWRDALEECSTRR